MELDEHETEVHAELRGSDLIEAVVSLTGLPHSFVREELCQILSDSGYDPRHLTLEQLRQAFLIHLEEVQVESFAKTDA